MAAMCILIGLVGCLGITARGCTTPGIMPMRDRTYTPFCCNPALGNTHCPAGARCEPDMYYGYGYVCCGSIQMVWDAFGGGYRRSSYEACGRPRAAVVQAITRVAAAAAGMTTGRPAAGGGVTTARSVPQAAPPQVAAAAPPQAAAAPPQHAAAEPDAVPPVPAAAAAAPPDAGHSGPAAPAAAPADAGHPGPAAAAPADAGHPAPPAAAPGAPAAPPAHGADPADAAGRHTRGNGQGGNQVGEDSGDYETIPANGWTVDSDSPLIAPIIVGDYQEAAPSEEARGWKGKGSVTLVRDGSCTILVDTGSPTDGETIVKGLTSFDLSPDDIQFVVITQGTPEHMGNQNVFAKSKIYYSWIVLDFDHFIMTDLGKAEFVRLCSRTELHLTPGVTKDSISLYIRNVSGYGTVAITGDVFLYEHAPDFIPKQYTSLVWDVQALLQSRERVLCQTDLIIPGHGPKFETRGLADSKLNCTSSGGGARQRERIMHQKVMEGKSTPEAV